MRHRIPFVLSAIATVLLVGWQVWASIGQDAIWSSTLDGGGGPSSGGGLELHGTVAQTDAQRSSGGGLQLNGGFWTGVRTLTAVGTGDLPSRQAVQLLPPVPNPFNPRTTLAFELPRAARVHVEIYDVSGRRVRALADGNYAAGRHEIVWSGRADNGQVVSSGTYFARLFVDGESRTQKMTLLK